MEKKLVVLSGAGMSAESGINTFRDAGGLWEGHDVMEVASPEGWHKNPELVLDFYNQRRKQLLEAKPNLGHQILADLQNDFKMTIITQNVDDLHERAGSQNVIHLHGELLKVRSLQTPELVLDWTTDLKSSDRNEQGDALRPHIVWFGEAVPEMERAINVVKEADFVIVIGTSLQVYPAASLMDYASDLAVVYYIDPNPAPVAATYQHLKIIPEKAGRGLQMIKEELINWGQIV
ncbi:NAD-dependent deacylase [Flavobacterium sp. NKUCC04_CG]|uniref:SIR2 family NAD-dependent protein deacylase n=1 Tax=Flavobacterium sp. NKUCC04_CG TaxID=2842121 RepID=UPI001C5BEC27|nr:NAD-dependent deacylase [Flavobacterium sp. NKUCC04_CG]MBW3518745.1 NAD-dependent deacylase [Flavobacterium sp. NKUCC04_CG]